MDTEKSTWKILLDEFEEEGHPDLHINGHDHCKVSSETGGGSSHPMPPGFECVSQQLSLGGRDFTLHVHVRRGAVEDFSESYPGKLFSLRIGIPV